MKEIINFDFLKNPFDGLTAGNVKEFQNKCFSIAKQLLSDFCIECGEKEKKYYNLAEIEFYYFDKNDFNEDWNIVTYARNEYKAGDLFYHLSGVDICFESKYSDNRFGGILIRSLKGDGQKLITGPLSCKDELLNACKGSYMPKLQKSKFHVAKEPKTTKRLLGQTAMIDNIDGDYNLCFYDGDITNWNTERTWYDKRKGVVKSIEKKYTIERNLFSK